MIEITNREKFKSGFGVWLAVADKFERCSEFGTKLAGNMVEHHCGMRDSKVPKFMANLFFSDVRPDHLDDGAPGVFCQTVGQLTAGGSSNDFTFVHLNPF